MIAITGIGMLFLAPVAHADPVNDQPPPDPAVVVQMDAQAPAPLSLRDVVDANPTITNPNLIFPGQIIALPGRDPHTVVSGETLNRIIGSNPANSAPSGPPPMAPVPAPSGGIAPLAEQAPPAVAHPTRSASGVNWDAVASCESGNNWAINTGNGYEGGVQFLNSTWNSVKPAGAPAHAYQASKEQQIEAAETLLHRSGIGQWPVCGKRG